MTSAPPALPNNTTPLPHGATTTTTVESLAQRQHQDFQPPSTHPQQQDPQPLPRRGNSNTQPPTPQRNISNKIIPLLGTSPTTRPTSSPRCDTINRPAADDFSGPTTPRFLPRHDTSISRDRAVGESFELPAVASGAARVGTPAPRVGTPVPGVATAVPGRPFEVLRPPAGRRLPTQHQQQVLLGTSALVVPSAPRREPDNTNDAPFLGATPSSTAGLRPGVSPRRDTSTKLLGSTPNSPPIDAPASRSPPHFRFFFLFFFFIGGACVPAFPAFLNTMTYPL